MLGYFRDREHPWVKRVNFVDIGAFELLEKARASLEEKQKTSENPIAHPCFVFDLDSTLVCTAFRFLNVYREFLRENPQLPKKWHQVLRLLGPEMQGYLIDETFYRAMKLIDSTTQMSEAREMWNEFRPFWQERFFMSRHIHFDEAYPGAADYVNRVLESGFEIVYLTGRDLHRGMAGTRRNLLENGFPLDSDGQKTHLFLKPHRSMGDLAFKARFATVLKSRFTPFVFMDNEPENLQMAAQFLPETEIVFFHSIMSPRVPEGDFQKILGDRSALRMKSFT